MFLLNNEERTPESRDSPKQSKEYIVNWDEKEKCIMCGEEAEISKYHKIEWLLRHTSLNFKDINGGKYIFTPEGIEKVVKHLDEGLEVINDNSVLHIYQDKEISLTCRFSICMVENNGGYSVISVSLSPEDRILEIIEKAGSTACGEIKGTVYYKGNKKPNDVLLKDIYTNGENEFLMDAGRGPKSELLCFWRCRTQDIRYGWYTESNMKDAIRFVPKQGIIVAGFGQFANTNQKGYRCKCWIKINREIIFERDIQIPDPPSSGDGQITEFNLAEDEWIYAEAGDLVDIVLNLPTDCNYYFSRGSSCPSPENLEANREIKDYFTVELCPDNDDYDVTISTGEIPYLKFYLY